MDRAGMYCCLAPPEFAALTCLSIAFQASLLQPIFETDWDACWAVGVAGLAQRKAAFMVVASLEHTIIMVDDVPVPAIGIADIAAWVEWLAWFDLNALTACDDGCPRPNYGLP